MRRLLIVLALLLPVSSVSPFGLPEIPKIPGSGGLEVPVKIPGLNKILKSKPALTTSFADAITGIPFLDDFTPPALAPMAEMPRGRQFALLLAPGGYEAVMESYCLHAGTHGPGHGEGYLWAPLKGALAPVITRILQGAVAHPEIEQETIQLLIWGILARTKINDMSDEIQRAARLLLTPRQIRQLNGGALGQVPPELMDRVFADLPPAVRQVLEAEARIRGMFAQGTSDFDAIEGVAVLPGDPEPGPGEETPRGRWSYKPGGFLVRYFPSGYSRTRTQVFIPPPTVVETDQLGRITAIADDSGRRIATTYDDSIEPAVIAGDDGVRGYAFASLTITAPHAQGSQAPRQVTFEGLGWTLTGTPSGQGRPGQSPGRFADLAQRYQWAVEHRRQLANLIEAVRTVGEDPLSEDKVQELFPRMMDLANYTQALRQTLADVTDADAQWARAQVALVQQAWMVGLVTIGDGAADMADAEQAQVASLDVGNRPGAILLASASLPPDLFAQHEMRPLKRPRFSDPWGLQKFRHRPRYRPLRPFRPGSGGSGDSATPAEQRQRLGQSGRPAGNQPSKGVLNRTKKAVGWISNGATVVQAVADPAGTLAGQVGFGIHGQVQSSYFDWLFSSAETISQQLGGDPPRTDFTVLEQPRLPSPQELGVFEGLPAARAAALAALRDSLADLVARMRAARISLDRLGGAVEAEDEEWIQRQGLAVINYKHSIGRAMITVADNLDALLDELAEEGINDITITAEAYAAYQQRLQAEGFTAQELQAAHAAGLGDDEIDAYLQQRLAIDPEQMAGSLIERGRAAASALRELGSMWVSIPHIPFTLTEQP